MPKMSPTAYAILGLLASRPWSAYELARHMKTSNNLRFIWPRAESKIYQAPKDLVARGWATSREESVKGRSRTVYRITAKGGRALRIWLEEPPALPHFEIEAALKVTYATGGSVEQLRETLRSIRAEQLVMGESMVASGLKVLEDGFAMPERAHTSALVAELVAQLAGAMAAWATWAEKAVSEWDEIEIDAEKETWARETYERILTTAQGRLEKARLDLDE